MGVDEQFSRIYLVQNGLKAPKKIHERSTKLSSKIKKKLKPHKKILNIKNLN
jgi:hypothetical protein